MFDFFKSFPSPNGDSILTDEASAQLLRVTLSALIAHNIDVAHIINALIQGDVDIKKEDLDEVFSSFNRASYEAGFIILAMYLELTSHGGPTFGTELDDSQTQYKNLANKLLKRHKDTLVNSKSGQELGAFLHNLDTDSDSDTTKFIPEKLEILAQRLFIGVEQHDQTNTH